MTTPVTTELPFTAEDVSTLVQEVSMAILDMDLVCVDPASDAATGGPIACVNITGDWDGLVVVTPSPQLALDATAKMFDLPPDEVGEEEMADALGELANIIGGSIKGLIPGTCALSLPTVVCGNDAHLFVPRAELVHTVAFAAGGEILTVGLWKQPRTARA
jgi:chemotaxis protein CheX